MKGFVNLIKPSGMTSAGVVAVVKRKLNAPCGHMGTLDPMASGVLPIGIGKASRLFQYMLDKKKKYIAEFTFGILTDTLDTTGEITDTTHIIPTKEQVEENLKRFIGKISQIPPKYSAKCVAGKRGYQLARAGVDFELAPKTVEILDYKLIAKISDRVYRFEIVCTGGTYIRSLARDLGYICNSLAVMSSLERVESGYFNIENGVTIEEFKNSENPLKYLIKPDAVINFPKLKLTEYQSNKILNGVYEDYGFIDGTYRVYYKDEFLGVGNAQNGALKINSYVR